MRNEIVIDPSPESGSLMRYECFDREKYYSWVPRCLSLLCLLQGGSMDPPQVSCLIKENLDDLKDDAISALNQIPGYPFYANDQLITEAEITLFFPDAPACYAL